MTRGSMGMLHIFRQPLIRLLSALILASGLGLAVSHAAAGGNADTVLPHYDPLLSATTATPIPRSTLARLRPSDQQALARGEAVTVLVEFEQSAAQALAARARRQARVVHDTPAILAERVRLYRQQKDRVLNSLSAIPFTIQRDYSHLPMSVLRLSPAALAAMARQPGVQAIHSEQMLRPLLDRSLSLIRQPEVAAQDATGAGTTVAVLDTGVDYTRAAFGSCTAPGGDCRVVVARDFGGDDNSLDDNGHGTNVAGIVLGVAPGARIAALDVFGTGLSSSFDVIEAIDWSIANRDTYNIVAMNLSLGYGSFTAPCDGSLDIFSAPLANARSAGILTAAAAGNDGVKNALSAPACAPAAISVGAVYDSDIGPAGWSNCDDAASRADQVTCFSSSADFLTLLAPGVEITAADLTVSGTSMAAPPCGRRHRRATRRPWPGTPGNHGAASDQFRGTRHRCERYHRAPPGSGGGLRQQPGDSSPDRDPRRCRCRHGTQPARWHRLRRHLRGGVSPRHHRDPHRDPRSGDRLRGLGWGL